MPRRRIIDTEGESTPELPGKRELMEARDDCPIVPAMPPILTTLNKLGYALATEVDYMACDAQEGKRLSTDGSLKARNITVAIKTAQEIQKSAVNETPMADMPAEDLILLIEEAERELERKKTK